MISYEIIFAVVFALFFYRAGVKEEAPGLLWSAISGAISIGIILAGGGLIWLTLGQAILFLGITVIRVMNDKQGGD